MLNTRFSFLGIAFHSTISHEWRGANKKSCQQKCERHMGKAKNFLFQREHFFRLLFFFPSTRQPSQPLLKLSARSSPPPPPPSTTPARLPIAFRKLIGEKRKSSRALSGIPLEENLFVYEGGRVFFFEKNETKRKIAQEAKATKHE